MSIKKIGEGSYADIYKPEIKNDGSIGTNHISKIFKAKKFWLEEIENCNIIKVLDPHNLFTISYIDFYMMENYIHSSLITHNIIYQIVYEYGGLDLTDLNVKLSLDELLSGLLEVFKGISIFNDNNYVHHDIKPANLLYNKDTGKIKLIDYGMSCYENKVYCKSNFADSDYYYFPIEFSIFNSLEQNSFSKKSSKIDYESVFDVYYTYSVRNYSTIYKKLYYYLTDDNYDFKSNKKKEQYTRFSSKIIEDLLNKDDTNYPKYFERVSAGKVDIYMLGITILELIKMYNIDKIPDIINELLHNMTNFNPIERITAKEAYEQLIIYLKL